MCASVCQCVGLSSVRSHTQTAVGVASACFFFLYFPAIRSLGKVVLMTLPIAYMAYILCHSSTCTLRGTTPFCSSSFFLVVVVVHFSSRWRSSKFASHCIHLLSVQTAPYPGRLTFFSSFPPLRTGKTQQTHDPICIRNSAHSHMRDRVPVCWAEKTVAPLRHLTFFYYARHLT